MAELIFCFNEQSYELVNQGSTTAALPSGYFVGMERKDTQGKTFYLAKAGGAIGANNLVKYSDTTGGTVIATAAATDIVAGVCEVAGGATAGQYFWMTVGGTAQVSCTGTSAAFTEVAASGTAGQAIQAPYTAATQQGVFGCILAANAGGPNIRAVRLQGLR